MIIIANTSALTDARSYLLFLLLRFNSYALPCVDRVCDCSDCFAVNRAHEETITCNWCSVDGADRQNAVLLGTRQLTLKERDLHLHECSLDGRGGHKSGDAIFESIRSTPTDPVLTKHKQLLLSGEQWFGGCDDEQ